MASSFSGGTGRNLIVRMYPTKDDSGYMVRLDNFQAIATRHLETNEWVLTNPAMNRHNVFMSKEAVDGADGMYTKAVQSGAFVLDRLDAQGDYNGTCMLIHAVLRQDDDKALVPDPDTITTLQSGRGQLMTDAKIKSILGLKSYDDPEACAKAFDALVARNNDVARRKAAAIEQAQAREATGPAPQQADAGLVNALGQLPEGNWAARLDYGSDKAATIVPWQGSVGLDATTGDIRSQKAFDFVQTGSYTIEADIAKAIPAVGGHGGRDDAHAVMYFHSDGKGGISAPVRANGKEDTMTGKWDAHRKPEDNMAVLDNAWARTERVRAAKVRMTEQGITPARQGARQDAPAKEAATSTPHQMPSRHKVAPKARTSQPHKAAPAKVAPAHARQAEAPTAQPDRGGERQAAVTPTSSPHVSPSTSAVAQHPAPAHAARQATAAPAPVTRQHTAARAVKQADAPQPTQDGSEMDYDALAF